MDSSNNLANLLARVARYFRDHPDDAPVGELLESEILKPVVLTKTNNQPEFTIDWLPTTIPKPPTPI